MKLSEINLKLNIDFNQLTLENIGLWPKPVKIIFLCFMVLIILCFGLWFDARTQIQKINAEIKLERKLKNELEEKQQLAANLDAYKKQVNEMKKMFIYMTQQLPDEGEIPSLLEEVSKVGTANGLEFLLFAPQAEEKKDFYAELPVKIKVIGRYDQIAHFVSDVGNMKRIVTLHDLKIAPISEDQKNKDYKANNLVMEILAKTYRYLKNE